MDSLELKTSEDDHKYMIFKQNDLFAESFPLMKEIRRQAKLCDVILKVSGMHFEIVYFYFTLNNCVIYFQGG